jgi:hypothetical protein
MLVMFAAAHYLAEHHAGEPNLGRRLEEIGRQSVEPSGPLIALCRGWPQSAVLSSIWSQFSDAGGFNAQAATAWLIGLKATSAQFANYVLTLPQPTPADRFWNFRVEMLRAVQDRLSRDREAQVLLLEGLKSACSMDILSSSARLLGTSAVTRKDLIAWVSGKIVALRDSSQLPEFAYDIMAGRQRPTEFCLLESCLVR